MKRVAAALWLVLGCAVEPAVAAAPNSAELIARCAPMVDAETLGAIVQAESSGHVFVLSDDGPARLPWHQRKSMIRSIYPGSAREAADIAHQLIGDGHLVGIGLTQINSQNLSGLGVTVEQLLDPCTNLAVGARLLRSLYQKALRMGKYPTPDQALGAAVSAYNTGNFTDGISNGYVSKVLTNMAKGLPQLWASAAPTRVVRAGDPNVSPRSLSAIKGENSVLKARTASLDVDW